MNAGNLWRKAWIVVPLLATMQIRIAGQASGETLREAEKLIASRELAQADDLLSELVQREPSNLAAQLKLGQVRLAQGLNEEAMTAFEAVLSGDAHSAEAQDGEVKAAEAAALADRNAGIEGSALLCLIRARKAVPDAPQLLFDYGVQAESMRIYADADEALQRAHALAPSDARILYALAHVELDEQKTPEAERDLRAYLEVRPEDATAHFGLGHLLRMVSRNEEAKAELEQSIALRPRQTASYFELGEIAREENDAEGARKKYEQVLDLAPQHGGALTGLGILAYRTKDYGVAEKLLSEAIRYAPDYVAAHHYYALVLAREGKAGESKREEELAEKLNQQQVHEQKGYQLTVMQ